MRGFIDAIGSDFVGSYFDVGDVVCTGYPEHWIKILGKRIKKVHFKDYRRQAAGLSGFVDLLAGDVDYPKIVAALLRQINYFAEALLNRRSISKATPESTKGSIQIVEAEMRSADRKGHWIEVS